MCRFCVDTNFNSLGKYQGAQLLASIVGICLVSEEKAKLSSKVVVSFCILPATHEACGSTSSPAFSVVSVPDFDHFYTCVVISLCCFGLHFPSAYDVKHLFMCLFAICISSWVRVSLAHILIKLFSYCLAFSVLCLFWVTVLCQMCHCRNIFFPSMTCLHSPIF